ncbi:hypothetical protein [Domibacillus enclensis]|uniref:Uncharacterized protein n=1 Tax=Domibacillus enclensis TaxID=1017273 RepID=A0A1N6UZL2_9BACI|nr:hypothetical protein [Domibacillus enclensis]OXS78663.1 hypothetical protein B1B05_08705 [Domibacillus enclensis]SIQ71040.1 hypothetical protein SAMN05443094_103417 [Domibacillus enclensis]
MKRYVTRGFLFGIILIGILVFQPFGSSTEELYGTVNFIDIEDKRITIDASNWAVENGLKEKETDIMIEKTAVIGENTVIKDGDGKTASLHNVFTGQKVSLIKDKKSDVCKKLTLNVD